MYIRARLIGEDTQHPEPYPLGVCVQTIGADGGTDGSQHWVDPKSVITADQLRRAVEGGR